MIATDPSLPGDQTFAAMFGNRGGDTLNRYHTIKKLTDDLSGYKIKNVNWNLEGYTVELASGDKQKFISVFTNGPQVTYDGGVAYFKQDAIFMSRFGKYKNGYGF